MDWTSYLYPFKSEDAIAESCPVCHRNCNCKACLCLDYQSEKKVYPVNVLPFLKRINDEQVTEMEMEATRQGIAPLELKKEKSDVDPDEHVFVGFLFLQDLHLRNLILKEEAKEYLNLLEVLKGDRNKSIDWMVEMQANSRLKDATVFPGQLFVFEF
ncbi:lysine-specific demethylase JMJ25-like [Malus sylvestris]|uniref:lysine-specific demethylase JMJ25-like n=1 Tax=Malus sylvestris TaxID=3752 RepID=UPI0021ACB84C|nr:lysine-specific demethylase JMJ25-like [Malus sylvestris]XP_050103376.1 lysine-specific demethylase JMJ25-like [Malus sylvestris]